MILAAVIIPWGKATSAVAAGRLWFFAAGIVLVSVAVGCAVLFAMQTRRAQPRVSQWRLEQIPFDGNRAYGYLKALCDIGPRPSGSPGMKQQQELLLKHFRELGAEAWLQEFSGRDPRTGQAVPMANVIARFFPERQERILLCAHYDTLPYPMLDRVNPKGRFIGANDGASGVAVLMEMAHHVHKLPPHLGVDLVCFDGEEFIFSEWDPYFQGSEYFAHWYVDTAGTRDWYYRAAVLFDMIGDADLQIYQERNSAWWPRSRWIVDEIWQTAQRLKVWEFIPQKKYEIRDDHISLHNIGGIPAIVLIDFDYPYWHTQQDTPDKCSPLSLAKVGWVVLEWLQTLKPVPNRPAR